MDLTIKVRVMNEPVDLRLAVNTVDLTNGDLFAKAAQKIIPATK